MNCKRLQNESNISRKWIFCYSGNLHRINSLLMLIAEDITTNQFTENSRKSFPILSMMYRPIARQLLDKHPREIRKRNKSTPVARQLIAVTTLKQYEGWIFCVIRAKIFRRGETLFGALEFRSSKGEIICYKTSKGSFEGEIKVSLWTYRLWLEVTMGLL
jgi:hypothetical protein